MGFPTSGANKAQQNVFVINTPAETPEDVDPYILRNQGYSPGAGLYFYSIEDDVYQQLIPQVDALAAFAYAAYGGMSLAVPVIGPDINATYQPIDFYDTVSVSPRGIVLDTVGGTFSFNLEGIYALSPIFSIEHNEAQAGRTLNFRIFNLTDGAGTTGILIGTGRNTAVTIFSGTILTEITTSNAGDLYRMEVARVEGADYTGVSWDACAMSLWNVGEFRGTLGTVVHVPTGQLTTELGDSLITEDGDIITGEHT